ncbi:MAG TPA: hypothetical protein VFQ35_12310 [Polyangiaceae bacterium]|nr:hypothetical protein [Polyangiaceae bacterium]
MSLRTMVAGRAALAASERAFDQGELRESVRLAGRAATLAVPGADHVELAYRRLVIIARGAEAAGRPHLAAFAWNTVRGAAVESAAPGFGVRPELELANQNLARLASRLATDKDDPASEREISKTLERPPGPSAEGLWLLAGGLVLLVAGLGCVGLLGFNRDGRAQPAKLGWGLLVVLLGAACWTLMAYRA